ncbi:hypothetical protein F4Z99_18620, partial [Candidatus Poribacteria bacterium]|nr:hypothetical protein [Candidatus Poribacteria bacterium]
MYTANKPIFEFLCAFIRENFLKDEGNTAPPAVFSREDPALVFYGSNDDRPSDADRIFKNFYRGPVLLDGLQPNVHFPLAWLEFGQIGDIEFESAPQGYCYKLRYQMPIFTRNLQTAGGIPIQETFRSDTDDSCARGVGDIVSEVVEKAWSELHMGFRPGGNFQFVDNSFHRVTGSSGQLPLNDVNWWVKQWSVDVNGEVVDTVS